jgi:hypothetical protein
VREASETPTLGATETTEGRTTRPEGGRARGLAAQAIADLRAGGDEEGSAEAERWIRRRG